MVTIRRLGPPDWRLLRVVRLGALADTPFAFGSRLADEETRDDDWWQQSVEQLAWFVAEAEGAPEPVGLVAGLPDTFKVISMWVAGPYRSRGVADRLLDAVEDWARAQGADTLVLHVSDRNPRARRFYERRGFRSTGRSEPLHRDRDATAVEMGLPLSSARSAP